MYDLCQVNGREEKDAGWDLKDRKGLDTEMERRKQDCLKFSIQTLAPHSRSVLSSCVATSYMQLLNTWNVAILSVQ